MKNPLVLTLKLDQKSFDYVDGLRQRYFPVERNFIPAHITLFHALPGAEEQRFIEDLNSIAKKNHCLKLMLANLFSLGNGVAIQVQCPELITLKSILQQRWKTYLTRQDQQNQKLHITVQNKVSVSIARDTYAILSAQWSPLEAEGLGFLLWRYQGGPWELIDEFLFKS